MSKTKFTVDGIIVDKPTEVQYEGDAQFTVITTQTLHLLFMKPEYQDALVLYFFYIRMSKIQRTNAPYATGRWSIKQLGWGKTRFFKARKILKELKLIEDKKLMSKSGTTEKWVIKVKFVWDKSNYPRNEDTCNKNCETNKKVTVLQNQTVANEDTILDDIPILDVTPDPTLTDKMSYSPAATASGWPDSPSKQTSHPIEGKGEAGVPLKGKTEGVNRKYPPADSTIGIKQSTLEEREMIEKLKRLRQFKKHFPIFWDDIEGWKIENKRAGCPTPIGDLLRYGQSILDKDTHSINEKEQRKIDQVIIDELQGIKQGLIIKETHVACKYEYTIRGSRVDEHEMSEKWWPIYKLPNFAESVRDSVRKGDYNRWLFEDENKSDEQKEAEEIGRHLRGY